MYRARSRCRRLEPVLTTCLVVWLTGGGARAAPAFIQVRGTRFVQGNRSFHFVGANVGVMHGPEQRRHARKILRAARDDGLRVVRIWALGEGPRTASRWRRRHVPVPSQ